MACGRGQITDTELRDRLRQLGVSPGPITDSTRNVYLHKLRALTESTRTSTTPPRLSETKTPEFRSKKSNTPPPPYSGARPPPPANAITPSSPSTPSPPPTTPVAHDNQKPLQGELPSPSAAAPQMMAGNLALSVVEKMALSFDKADHFANDTVFIFQTGQFLFASRSMLSVQCPKMTPWLFSGQDRFPVTVVTITGQSTRYYVHPDEYVVDLKQKISLDQGYSVADQNLIFGEKSLINFTTLSSCGVIRESRLTLMLVGNSTTTATTSGVASHINPALSIGHLSLGLHLDSLVGGGAPVSPTALARQHPVSSHISRIVHVHDVPYEGLRMLMVYLYCRDLVEPQNLNKVGAYVGCFILAEFFNLPCLSQLCLAHIQSVLVVESALSLVRFAETVGSPLLHQLAVEFLKLHHKP